MDGYYKIGEFADKLGSDGPHSNTIDRWFKDMEKKNIHYVNRVGDEKVYDDLDLEIAKHIHKRRGDGWSLQAIYTEIQEQLELRPFPDEFAENSNLALSLDLEMVKRKFSEDMRTIIEDVVKAEVDQVRQQYESIIQMLPKQNYIEDAIHEQVAEVKSHYEEIIKQMPKPVDPLEERQRRITDEITRERVKSQLRKEALHQWSTKPEEERMRRAGWFKKEEDRDKRDQFISDYIDENFAERLKQEYGL